MTKLIDAGSKHKLLVVETLALLCRDNDQMQRAASDAKLIPRLIKEVPLVEKKSKSELEDNEYFTDLHQVLLVAIGEIVSNNEESRLYAIGENAISIVERGMRNESSKIRAAACLLARYLSRSARIIHTKMSESQILPLILDLLDDYSEEVRIMASSILPNILLDYSPMRQIAIDKGIISKLVFMLEESSIEIRKNVLWSIKNLLSMSTSSIKQKVMRELTYMRLLSFLNDSNDIIKEQAVNILRNLVCSSVEDITETVNSFGRYALESLLVSLLKSENETILLHTLYTITNICIGTEDHKNMIIFNDEIMKSILAFLV
ncbi:hypothetical protein BB560_001263 [Smittium megazygosporum]|uniref:Uncharacterized protein n=1 Tax=Smittium megazygosporum TaxID=133381 RepID=A0A2T9ZI51_9FUNG|nr:hypothetical protein BB560_001263 [Smittium megazygosporum]